MNQQKDWVAYDDHTHGKPVSKTEDAWQSWDSWAAGKDGEDAWEAWPDTTTSAPPERKSKPDYSGQRPPARHGGDWEAYQTPDVPPTCDCSH